MLKRDTIAKLWAVSKAQWVNSEDDDRKNDDVIVDFTIDTIDSETREMSTALNNTNQLMSVLLADPLVQKDQKDFIKKRLEANKQVLMKGENINA